MPVKPDDLRVAMRRWTTGVSVVTAKADDTPQGMTVSAFASVSLEPPQVLVCIEQGTRTHDAISKSGAFAVSILNEDQQEYAERFAGQLGREDDRFAGVSTRTASTGAPVLDGANAYLDCRVDSAHDTGTHTIFVGVVEASGVSESARRPLLYYSQGYRQLVDDS